MHGEDQEANTQGKQGGDIDVSKERRSDREDRAQSRRQAEKTSRARDASATLIASPAPSPALVGNPFASLFRVFVPSSEDPEVHEREFRRALASVRAIEEERAAEEPVESYNTLLNQHRVAWYRQLEDRTLGRDVSLCSRILKEGPHVSKIIISLSDRHAIADHAVDAMLA